MSSRVMKVKILGDSKHVEKMFGRVGTAGASMGSKITGAFRATAGAVGGLIKGLAVGVTTLGGVLTAGAFSLANTAADLGEAQSKAGVIFDSAAGEIDAFAESAVGGFGLSQRAATDFASKFGTLLKPAAEGPAQLAAMSTALTGLSADLASFNNLESADVADKIFAGLGGEAEPLKALGVFINSAQVEAKALELGLGDVNGEVTEAAKVQARYALILEQTADAQGDFARTSDGLANQQRRLGAVWENVKGQLGAGLAPVFARILGNVSDVLPGIIDGMMPAFERFAGMFGVALEGAADFVYTLATGFTFDEGSGALTGFAQTVRSVVLDDLLPAMRTAVGWVGDNWPTISSVIGTVFGAVGTAVGFVVTEVLPRVIAVGAQVVGWVRDNWPEISEKIGTVLDTAETTIGNFVGVATAFWEAFGETITETLTEIWDSVGPTLEGIFGVVNATLETFEAGFEGDWGAVWEGLKTGFEAGWGLFQEAADLKVTLLGTWLEGLNDKLAPAMTGIGEWLYNDGEDWIQGLWDGAKSRFGTIGSGLKGWVYGLPSHFDNFSLSSLWSTGWDWVQTLADGILDAVNSFLPSIQAAFSSIAGIFPGAGLLGSLAGGIVPGLPTTPATGAVGGNNYSGLTYPALGGGSGSAGQQSGSIGSVTVYNNNPTATGTTRALTEAGTYGFGGQPVSVGSGSSGFAF